MSGQNLLLNPLHCQKTVWKGRFCVLPDPCKQFTLHSPSNCNAHKESKYLCIWMCPQQYMETQAWCQATAAFVSTCETLQVFKVNLHLAACRLKFRITNTAFFELLPFLLAQAPSFFGGKADFHQVHIENAMEALAWSFKELVSLRKINLACELLAFSSNLTIYTS